MQAFQVHIGSNLRWVIKRGDSSRYSFTSIPSLTLVNPFLYPQLLSPSVRTSNEDFPFFVDLDKALISSTQLIVYSNVKFGPGPDGWSKLTQQIEALLTKLRHSFKQADLSEEVHGLAQINIDALPQFDDSRLQRKSHGVMRSYLVDTAVDWSSLAKIDQAILEFSPEIFDTILLDAIQALWRGDNRKAILYAAIAVETLANSVLDDAYQELLQSGDRSGRFRLVTLAVEAGQTVVKDPVYDSLSQKTDFRLLIHERSLYLLGRSILTENQPLYIKAKKLYHTRNKIVHWGEPSSEHDTFRINRNDAQEAVVCAVDVFKWFGFPSYEHISRIDEWKEY
jgi:hypothetical protein